MAIKFIICGIEHTGTTLISDLFRQIPNVDAGFEVGVLLRDTPEEFRDLQPFAKNMLPGWGLTVDAFNHCCDADSHHGFYERLIEGSTVLNDGTTTVFDKTPRYLSQLDEVAARMPVPIIASYKDPRSIVYSDYKRAKTNDFNGWYNGYFKGKRMYIRNCYEQYLKAKDNDQVMFMPLEQLAMDARNSMENMFNHAGEKFSLDYVIMKGLRYANTRSKVVSADITFEFFKRFTPNQLKRVEGDFAEFEDWFYN